jgi:hypothetical protein
LFIDFLTDFIKNTTNKTFTLCENILIEAWCVDDVAALPPRVIAGVKANCRKKRPFRPYF